MKSATTRYEIIATEPSPKPQRELTDLSVRGVTAHAGLTAHYETFLSDQAALGKILPPTDPVHRKLAERLDDTVRALGGNPHDFTVHVLRDPTINAFVIPGVSPAPVFITSGLLGALTERYGEVTKGHLALIFGHETAHVRDEAYTRPKPIDRTISRNPFFESRRPVIEDTGAQVIRLLEGRAGGRNEEYTCDQHGLRAARRLGATDAEPVEVLRLFAELDDERKSRAEHRPSHLSAYAAVMQKLSATHPASQRRVDRGEGYQRLLSVHREHPSASPTRETALASAELAPVRELTPLQATLKAFTTALVEGRAKTTADTASIIEAALTTATDVTTLQHIALIAGLHKQAVSGVDFTRFGGFHEKEGVEDRRGTNERVIASHRFIDRDLSAAFYERALDLAPADLSPTERQVVAGTVVASFGGCLAASDLVEPTTQANVGETIAAVARLARVPFEGATLDSRWLGMIHRGSAGRDAAEVLAAQAFDQRAEYLSTLVLPTVLVQGLPFDATTRILGELATHVPTLFTDDKAFRIDLTNSLTWAIKESDKDWPSPLTLAAYRATRAVIPNQPVDPVCVALPLAPLLYQAGRTGEIEIFEAMAHDTALPEKTRSLLGVIFLNARIFDTVGKRLTVAEAGDFIETSLKNSGIVVEPVPVTDRYPTSHSRGTSDLSVTRHSRPIWEDIIEPNNLANYEKLPPYLRGFSRTLALVGLASSDLPRLELDPSDIGLSLIGIFPNRLRIDFECDLGILDKTSASPALIRQVNYACASEEDQRSFGLYNRSWAPAELPVRHRLADSVWAIQTAHAATVDLTTIRNQELRRFIEQTQPDADITRAPQLIHAARDAVLPALAGARPYIAGSRHDYGAHLTSVTQLQHDTEQTLALYTDYRRFSETRFNPRSVRAQGGELLATTPDSLGLENIAFLAGRALFDLTYRYGPPELAAEYAAKTPAEKVACILEHFIAPSAERDEHLVRALQEIPAGDDHAPVKREIFHALYSPLQGKKLGLELYEKELRATPHASALERLEQIITFLPRGSSQRDAEIRGLYDGRNGSAGLVTGWSDHRALEARLRQDEQDTAPKAILRGAGIDILLDAVQDRRIPPSERARVLLWIAGLRESTTLVECLELATERRIRDLKKESDLLTAEEKQSILYEALAGPTGILREAGTGRDIFLDTLFIGVFKPLTANPETLRQCKACFDTMMKRDEPERAARFLATCMVGYLEHLSEPEQVKLLFSSYGALGPKAAQQILARTNLFDAPTRHELMDLTSRVPGGSSAELYAALERTYGRDAEQFVKDIRPVGGGSFQQVWEVTFWNAERSGPGDSLICCKLRPDVITDLAGDLRTTQGLADAMEAAPELFGGSHLNRRAGEVIALQSALETNYDFLVAQQEGARREVADMEWRKGEPRVAIPEIVRTHRYVAEEGSPKTVELTNGEFLFMRRAAGVTLDRYLTANPTDQKSIGRALAQFTVRQALNGGHLHCDLHPGNILVERGKDGTLTLSLIDWGISTQTPQLVSDGMRHILSIAAGARGEEFDWRNVVKALAGAGKVDETAGAKALADFVYVLGIAGGGAISAERAEALGAKLYTVLNRPESPIQARLQAIEPILAEAGVRMPLSVDYMLRGLGTLTYVWNDLGEGEIWGILKSELKRSEKAARAGTVDRRALTEIFTALGAECGIDTQEISAAVSRVGAAKDRNAQVARAIAELRGMYARHGDRDGAARIVSNLMERGSDLGVQIGHALGIKEPGTLLDELYAIDRLAHSSGAEFARVLPPLETVGEWCKTKAIGQVKETWSAPLHPGTVVRAAHPGRSPTFYITLYGPACDSPSECGVVSLDSGILSTESVRLVRKYLDKASAEARERGDAAERAIPSIVSGPKQRAALVELMNSFDSEGVTIGRLLSDPNRRVEYFTGEEWRDLRALRLA